MAEGGPLFIQPFPHFTAWRNGSTVPGAKLYTYVANTTTPKRAYHDPFFATPHANPLTLDAFGEATVYLDGAYHLMLYDQGDVLLWDVLSFEFATQAAPVEGTLQTGSTVGPVAAVAGQGQLLITYLVPLGYRVLGVTSTITTTFGTSAGLTGFMVGDGTVLDGWGVYTNVTSGQSKGQADFRRGDMPVNPFTYTIRISALGGLFDATGSLEVRAHWQGLLHTPAP